MTGLHSMISSVRRCRRWTARRGEHGAVAVELALTLPFLMILLVGIVDIGDAFNAYVSVVAASRDGARLGSRGNASDSEVNALVLTDVARLRSSTGAADITIARNVVPGQNSIRVEACHDHRLLVPYPLLPVPNPLRMCAATTMRVLDFS